MALITHTAQGRCLPPCRGKQRDPKTGELPFPGRGGLVQSCPERPAQMVSLNSLGNVYLMDKFRFLEQRKQMLLGSVFEASLPGRG